MKALPQKRRDRVTCAPGIASLTSLALGICLLFGPGFRASNLTLRLYSEISANYFESSYQPDSAITRLERQGPASEKAPRRQVSFGVLPSAVELAPADGAGVRTVAEVRCDRLITASHQNDRAPPC